MSELLKLENQLCHRFYTLSNAFTRAYRPLLKALDITYPQYVTLMALWENDDITIAMSLILKKLEDKGFLVITKDKADKRVKRVKLTEMGKQKKIIAEEVPAQMLCKLNGMTAEESRTLKSLLDKLGGCFENADF